VRSQTPTCTHFVTPGIWGSVVEITIDVST